MSELWLWPLGLGLLGLVFGSFIATVAIRWPEGRSALNGRSQCDSCGKTLGPGELVPVLSYALQFGRCRSCKGRIDPSHLATELVGMAIGLSAGFVAPGLEGAVGAVFGWLLLALAALDLAAFWLPNLLTGALAVTGLGSGLAGFEPVLADRLIGGAVGFGALWLVAFGYQRLRGRHGLGGGDAKLFGGIGLWLGWQGLPIVLLTASLMGLLAVLSMRVLGRAVTGSDRVPFGPFLALGAWAEWLVSVLSPM